jgi:hypothetical protein
MGDRIQPMTAFKINSTEDAIKFFGAMTAECRSRGFRW